MEPLAPIQFWVSVYTARMSFFTALWARPAVLSRLSRYTIGNGILYLVLGAGFYLSPEWLLELQFMAELEGYDVGLCHTLGGTLFVIGWFYVMGGRTGAASFGLSTVVDRALVPLLFGPLVVLGEVAPMMLVPILILDPLLAIGAYLVWRSERSA